MILKSYILGLISLILMNASCRSKYFDYSNCVDNERAITITYCLNQDVKKGAVLEEKLYFSRPAVISQKWSRGGVEEDKIEDDNKTPTLFELTIRDDEIKQYQGCKFKEPYPLMTILRKDMFEKKKADTENGFFSWLIFW